jgi:hypothetical protein
LFARATELAATYVEAGKGIVALQHSIVDFTSWPWWYEDVTGGKSFEPELDKRVL